MMKTPSLSPQPLQPPHGYTRAVRQEAVPPAAASFAEVLKNRTAGAAPLRFSAHAEQRLRSRGIQFDDGQMQRLENAAGELAGKGGRESLVLLDGVALVLNVPRRTVITAMPEEEARNNVFTNIDSAVVASA
jgi:flagellar operon protein